MSLDLPIRAALDLRKFINAFNDQVKVYGEMSKVLKEKHAKRDVDGKMVVNKNGTIPLKDKEAYADELQELLDATAELPTEALTAFTTDFLEASGLKINLPELDALEKVKGVQSEAAATAAENSGEAKTANS
jgi:hypothetical protein